MVVQDDGVAIQAEALVLRDDAVGRYRITELVVYDVWRCRTG